MKKLVAILALIALAAAMSWAEDDRAKELSRVQNAGNVLNEIMQAPDKGIPAEILTSAECVAVVPSMLKAGFVFGGRYGKGVATCRHGESWSAPAPFRIEGGSWGLQIGGEAVDLVMLVMNQKGMQQLLQSKFKLGADASAAAGPVGRHVEGTTDWKMRAEVLTYSRARGAFAGITLNGAVIKQDQDDSVALYGKEVPFADLLSGRVPAPAGTQPFLAEVARYFRQAQAGEVAQRSTSGTTATTAQSNTAGAASGTAPSTTTAGTAGAGTSAPAQSPPATGTTGSVGANTSSRTGAADVNAGVSAQTQTGQAAATGSTSSENAASGSTAAGTSTAPPSSNAGANTGAAGTGGMAGTASSSPAQTQGTQTGTTGNVGSSAGGSTSTTQPQGSTATQPQGATGAGGSAESREVKDQIQQALANEPGLSSSNVVVNVTSDTVELSGSVPNQSDKATIKRIAQQNAGNRKVDDSKLTVK